ncbi:MAG TPA: hypothetical protein VEL76_14195, partial [Gemmataceae bacterium]|nr:hypothetical protein [Gemmataceae bacterium]
NKRLKLTARDPFGGTLLPRFIDAGRDHQGSSLRCDAPDTRDLAAAPSAGPPRQMGVLGGLAILLWIAGPVMALLLTGLWWRRASDIE